jgi:hypothetical protein
MSDDNVIIDRNQRYLDVALGSQLIDQLGFRRRWEGCFDDRADGRTISRFFGTNDHAGTLPNLPTPIERRVVRFTVCLRSVLEDQMAALVSSW